MITMKSLFEKEEKETAIRQLKVNLISRFYAFAKGEVLTYKSVLNFDRYHLMNNDTIQWDMDLLDSLSEKVDWSALWKIKNIKLDLSFFKKYDSKIDFSSIHLSKNIEWSDRLLLEYGDRFDWSRSLITKEPLSTIENLRKHKAKLDWSLVSQRISIEFTESILEEFSDKWDWKNLSANEHLPLSVEFIEKHAEQLDFDVLSQNPKAIGLIYKYPAFKKWNWAEVILNPAVNYSKDSFDFLYSQYRRQYETKEFTNTLLKKMALPSFLSRVLSRQRNDISYFLRDDFKEYLPWENLGKFCNTKFTLNFIEENKNNLNFKESEFIRNNCDVFSIDFIEDNIDLFNPTHDSFYYLPLTINLLSKLNNKVNWNSLSSSKKLDWSWEFIDIKFDKFNFFRLSENKGLYEQVILNKMTKKEIFEYLDSVFSKI
jgi:hypothetical protein